MEVILKCVKDNGKLRIKIESDGYFKNANCRFPKNLRLDGIKYTCPSQNIKLIRSAKGTYYYSIKNKNIKILNSLHNHIEKIYGDDIEEDCVICLSDKKNTVFSPCGHYVCCEICSSKINICPICRSNINSSVKRQLIS